ncbi:hypothetical protein [Pectobacterium parmentieri]|uniref:Uncharacterized protein n=1 Tax=Pectobacterium parmentieri TaxID=1905730 RepID=A0ABS0RYH5_PECPM|nr:hypothetical protein [Pectobacterium parmentieri]MBI0471291.1 hypothetical protein [Pectobacterium parmentieri]MBI0493903.1 hypothetical protein [Pectobacterium parmentieri]MBI0554675.1 hypothetical protein [Pectobacterium parmentieri]MBI0568169.1 hypothetical protein [Pectobacterium parmentieri]MBI0573138.1 hypothetical protein [Pectobacterium parmentieri]
MKKFFPISEIVSQYGIDIEFIISEWIKGKFCIFVSFDGELCTMRHALDYERKDKDFKFHLNLKTDPFQNVENPLHEYLSFIPEQPLDDHFRTEYKADWSGPFFKGYDEITYNGRAYGYWYLKPTKTTHFGRDHYILSDQKNYNDLKSKSGVMFVSAFKDFSYNDLVFHKPIKISVDNLFIEKEMFGFVVELYNLSSNDECVVNVDLLEKTLIEDGAYFPPTSKIAIYVLINEVLSRDGRVVPSKVSDFFSNRNMSINQTTVKGWLERPEERNKPFRDSARNNKIINLLLREYCEGKEGMKNPHEIANKLTSLANVNPYNFNIKFTSDVVSKWLKLNQ